MSMLQAYVGAMRRAKSPQDVIEDLETQIEILQAIVRDLSGADVVADLKRIYPKIPLMSLRVLAVFLRRDIASRAALMAALYGDRLDVPGEKVVEVHLCKLRVRLPAGSIVNHWGMGWSLSPEVKAEIRARLAALNAPPPPRPESELPEEHSHAATGSAGG